MRSAAFSNPHSEACRQPAAVDRRRSPLSLFVCLALWLTACRISAATESDCASAEGLAPVIGPGRVVLLGEIHGTRHAPQFAGTVVCQALNKELGVTLALELPHAEEVAVRGFVTTAAQAGEPPRVTDLPFWAKPYQDGRSSDAMLSLLERVRAWRLAGQVPQHDACRWQRLDLRSERWLRPVRIRRPRNRSGGTSAPSHQPRRSWLRRDLVGRRN